MWAEPSGRQGPGPGKVWLVNGTHRALETPPLGPPGSQESYQLMILVVNKCFFYLTNCPSWTMSGIFNSVRLPAKDIQQ